MEYVDLKEKLEKLLIEDLSNRNTLQDTRRNLFLNSEGTEVQKELISQKETEITNLTTLVEKKKTLVQLKDDEITGLKNQVKELQQKLSSAEKKKQQEAKNNEELSKLSIQNEEYSAKIRELIYHIDKQNSEIEALKGDLATKTDAEKKLGQLPLFEEKLIEFERLEEKLNLVSNSERTLKMLVASQNTEIEKHNLSINALKTETEEIVAGWQQQQEQLLIDNATLQADLVLLNQQYVELQQQTITIDEVKEAEINEVKNVEVEKERLLAEFQAVQHELEKITQQRDEKVLLLQGEINLLQGQITSLQENITNETAEKQKLNEQLTELTSIVSQKEEHLTNKIEKTSDEDVFIDKLLSQVNLLNEQKLTFETLYETTEAGLKEANELVTNLTQMVENQKSTIFDLEQTNKNISLAQILMLQVKDKTVAKQAIDELVGEIERCIALLSE
ncbi:MAG: hypothetical protein ACYDCN_16045 [Bacteroidia bacterium]